METKIKHLEKLAGELKNICQDEDFLYRVEGQNQWFTPNFVKLSLDNIVSEFLNETALKNWLNNYSLSNKYSVGIILAGNIPAVGFHDILCAYFAAKKVYIKLYYFFFF